MGLLERNSESTLVNDSENTANNLFDLLHRVLPVSAQTDPLFSTHNPFGWSPGALPWADPTLFD